MSKPEGLHTCVLCDSKLESKDALKDHFRKHANNEIDFKGSEVDPKRKMQELTDKKRTSVKGTGSQDNINILCDICGEAFTCNAKAVQHKFRKHPKNAPNHYCPQCGMQFPLQAHRDKHLKEQHDSGRIMNKAYRCSTCGALFHNTLALEYHYKSAHHRVGYLNKRIATPPPSKKISFSDAGEAVSTYYCHLCGREYTIKCNLEQHIERQHSQKERSTIPVDLIKCTKCDGLFYNQKSYINHNRFHTPNDIYVTSEEQREQTLKKIDIDFDVKRVQTTGDKYILKFRKQRTNIVTSTNIIKVKREAPSSDDEMSPPPNSDLKDTNK